LLWRQRVLELLALHALGAAVLAGLAAQPQQAQQPQQQQQRQLQLAVAAVACRSSSRKRRGVLLLLILVQQRQLQVLGLVVEVLVVVVVGSVYLEAPPVLGSCGSSCSCAALRPGITGGPTHSATHRK
jgi:hypothetical protein